MRWASHCDQFSSWFVRNGPAVPVFEIQSVASVKLEGDGHSVDVHSRDEFRLGPKGE